MHSECPNNNQLSSFACGRLPEDQAMEIEDHLQDCQTCEETVASLSSNTIVDTDSTEPTTVLSAEKISSDSASSAATGLDSLMAGLQQIPSDFRRKTTEPELQSLVGVGAALGNYELTEKIAESGMGVVYKARHRKLGSLVALKVLRPHAMSDPTAVERFHQEVAASGKLEHPNIVLARDADEVDGVHFLVMELVDGSDLSKLVTPESPMSVANACEIIRQTAEALQHVDDNGMVHRDIKPSNLMLAKSGQVKLLDLGLAKLREDKQTDDDQSITSTGQVMGTVDYMSPEQANDSRTADIRADVYSLGCTLHFLLTGKAPFRREGKLNTLLAHTSEQPPKLPDHVPAELNDLYQQMLSKEPSQRLGPPQVIAEKLAQFTAGAKVTADVRWPNQAVTVKIPPASEIDTSSTAAAESFSIPPIKAESRANSHRPPPPNQTPPNQTPSAQTRAAGPGPAVAGGYPNELERSTVPKPLIFGVASLLLVLACFFGWQQFLPGDIDPANNAESTVVQGEEEKVAPTPKIEAPGDIELAFGRIRFTHIKIDYPGDGPQTGDLLEVGNSTHCPLFSDGLPSESDQLQIDVEFNEPRYAFLFALNPNGVFQSCYPALGQESVAQQEPLLGFTYPADDESGFRFSDGPGPQAFFLVASTTPLGSLSDWKDRRTDIRWPPAASSGPWVWDQSELRPFAAPGQTRGAPKKMPGLSEFMGLAKQIEASDPYPRVYGLMFEVEARP